MKTEKKLGIWMDHSIAHLMEFNSSPNVSKIIESKFTHLAKEESLHKNENRMHTKEQHQQSEYFNQIGAEIKNYDEIILFGPTNAKVELFNNLRKDLPFEKIKIKVKNADKMTKNQQLAFVREHYENPSQL